MITLFSEKGNILQKCESIDCILPFIIIFLFINNILHKLGHSGKLCSAIMIHETKFNLLNIIKHIN